MGRVGARIVQGERREGKKHRWCEVRESLEVLVQPGREECNYRISWNRDPSLHFHRDNFDPALTEPTFI